jgi:PAS domain-containing protein
MFLARSYMFTDSLQVFPDQTAQRKERAPIGPRLPMVGQLFDLLPVAIYVCDSSGLMIYYNSHAAELWGRSPSLNDPSDRFCGSYRMYHLDGGPIEHPDCPMGEVLRSGDSVQNREIVVERAGGSRGVVLINVTQREHSRRGQLLPRRHRAQAERKANRYFGWRSRTPSKEHSRNRSGDRSSFSGRHRVRAQRRHRSTDRGAR